MKPQKYSGYRDYDVVDTLSDMGLGDSEAWKDRDKLRTNVGQETCRNLQETVEWTGTTRWRGSVHSRSHILDSRSQIPDPRFQIPDSRFQIPDSMVEQSITVRNPPTDKRDGRCRVTFYNRSGLYSNVMIPRTKNSNHSRIVPE